MGGNGRQICQGTEHREGIPRKQEELGRGMVGLKNEADSGTLNKPLVMKEGSREGY